MQREQDAGVREAGAPGAVAHPEGRSFPPLRWSARSFPRAAILLAAAALLASCAFIPVLGPNQAYLTITNPNKPTQGTFTYTTIILDGVLLPYTVTAGASLQLAVTYNQSHTLSYTFSAQPNGGGTVSPRSVGPIAIFVPQGGYVYLGVVYP